MGRGGCGTAGQQHTPLAALPGYRDAVCVILDPLLSSRGRGQATRKGNDAAIQRCLDAASKCGVPAGTPLLQSAVLALEQRKREQQQQQRQQEAAPPGEDLLDPGTASVRLSPIGASRSLALSGSVSAPSSAATSPAASLGGDILSGLVRCPALTGHTTSHHTTPHYVTPHHVPYAPEWWSVLVRGPCCMAGVCPQRRTKFSALSQTGAFA